MCKNFCEAISYSAHGWKEKEQISAAKTVRWFGLRLKQTELNDQSLSKNSTTKAASRYVTRSTLKLRLGFGD